MYKLYYSPGACSMAVHVVLNELNVKFELEKVSLQDRDPAFLKINPRGQVPVLMVDGEPVKEGAAILMYLFDTHGSPMMPKSGMARAKALEWLMWANSSLHPAYSRAFSASRIFSDKAMQDIAFNAALSSIQSYWDEAEARLGKTKYLAGDQMTAADIMITVFANWGQAFPSKPKLGPNVMRIIREISARPSYRQALETEQVEYKAAA
jgi:glutathione S-transferase